jgi:hypothetical protein
MCKYLERGGFGSDSVCAVTKKKVSSWTRDNVCTTFMKYQDCEDYKRGIGGCYLTTACVQALQDEFDDDCWELTELRRFRDEYVEPNHADDVRRYYEVAPRVVQAIDASPDATVAYSQIYRDMVTETVTRFKQGDNEGAYLVYKQYVRALEERYLA